MKRTELTIGLAALMALGLCACASTGEGGTATAQPQSAQPQTYHSVVEDSARRNSAHVHWINPPRVSQTDGPTAEAEAAGAGTGMATMANPASEYCISQGGELEITSDDAGNQTGMCTLPDGSVIEEWELFRRDHPQP